MSYPIENRQKLTFYILIWMLYALIHAVVMRGLVPLPFGVLFADALFRAVLWGILSILLWNVLLYGNYDKIPFFQRMINYVALAVLSVGLWLGIGCALDYLFLGGSVAEAFVPVLPLYALIGMLIYLLVMSVFRYKMLVQNLSESDSSGLEDDEPMSEEPDAAIAELPQDSAEILERVAVKSGHKIHVVLVPDIYYLQADGDYVHIHTEKGKYMKEQTMKYFEESLPATQFVRVHRSYIVNVQAISRIEQYEKQNQLLTLKNGDKIKVSVGGYKLLKQRLGL